ncbi:MAG: ROK family transcriptional regulator [Roseibium sp.]|uniref:ROK family transcriptional regulator n=1 Tax=Roseibium sp. TaxID=1936156 RepID=UPI00260F8639|nr:ROK family transcriptional regulator [Roseibium sp.]MCV0425080.1 ROK family transcriptional regulator [Roseibium sp.]
MNTLQKPSARRLIQLLRAQGPISRLKLADLLDVQPSTVTRIVNQLLDDGLLVEEVDPNRAGRRGYPSKLLQLRPMGLLSAGVFIDPERYYICIVNALGEVVSEETSAITDREFAQLMELIGASVDRQIRQLGLQPDRFIGCGISYPGQHTSRPGIVRQTQYFSEWPEIDASKDFAPYFDMPVHQLNDAKCACLAELHFGSCRSIRNFSYIWLSHGVGGAAVINQSLYLGKSASAAEFGGLFPKSKPRPSGSDLLATMKEAGLAADNLEQIREEDLQHECILNWVDRVEDQLRWLSLIITRTMSPDAIVLGGRLPDGIFSELIERLSASTSLGEDHFGPHPTFIRAEADKKPHLGAAALPLYLTTNPNVG